MNPQALNPSSSPSSSTDILTLPVSDRDHIRGDGNAPITLLEYGDYECPDCEQAAPVVNKLRKHFGDKLRFAYRHFPNSAIHPHASVAAHAAEAAGAQGKFWEMHDVLFKHQKDLIDHDITHFGLMIGVELYRFEAEIASQRYAPRVKEDYDSGVSSGAKGTPTFFINGKRYRGKSNVEALAQQIQSLV
jgi:protein-disulfide isomerase